MVKFSNIKNTLRKIARYGWYIPVSNVAMNYGGRFLSENRRRHMSEKRNAKVQKILRPIVEEVCRISVPSCSGMNRRTIWVCWFQGEGNMPEIAKLCLASIRHNANGHEVILLTEENYSNYVSLPEIIVSRYKSGQLKSAHFADMIRIYLLAQRGGLWLDSTMLVVRPISDNVFDMPFYTIKTPEEGHYVSKCRWAVFALGAHAGNPLFVRLAKAFELYLSKTDLFVDYFMFDHFIDMLYQADKDIRTQIDAVPYNNGNVHGMNRLLCDDFNGDTYDSLTVDTSMFKLSNRSYSKEMLDSNPESYYSHLKGIY